MIPQPESVQAVCGTMHSFVITCSRCSWLSLAAAPFEPTLIQASPRCPCHASQDGTNVRESAVQCTREHASTQLATQSLTQANLMSEDRRAGPDWQYLASYSCTQRVECTLLAHEWRQREPVAPAASPPLSLGSWPGLLAQNQAAG
jgi:hypothetical protein